MKDFFLASADLSIEDSASMSWKQFRNVKSIISLKVKRWHILILLSCRLDSPGSLIFKLVFLMQYQNPSYLLCQNIYNNINILSYMLKVKWIFFLSLKFENIQMLIAMLFRIFWLLHIIYIYIIYVPYIHRLYSTKKIILHVHVIYFVIFRYTYPNFYSK